MGMKSKTKTEIKVMEERLIYFAGKIQMTKSLWMPELKNQIYESLGLRKNVKDDGTVEWNCDDESVKPIGLIYKDEYVKTAKKLNLFYEALDKMPNEKTKMICELRYVDGYSFKEIAKMVNESEQNLFISFRPVIVKILKENDCEWCLGYDK